MQCVQNKNLDSSCQISDSHNSVNGKLFGWGRHRERERCERKMKQLSSKGMILGQQNMRYGSSLLQLALHLVRIYQILGERKNLRESLFQPFLFISTITKCQESQGGDCLRPHSYLVIRTEQSGLWFLIQHPSRRLFEIEL